MSKVNSRNGTAKPRGKPFQKGADERRDGGFKDRPDARNNAGQRSREVVATAAQARELYVRVLHEPINTPPDPAMTNLELIVRQHVAKAKQGDAGAREQMLDRIWGKALQPIKHEFDDLPDSEIIRRAAQLTATIAAGLAGIAGIDDKARDG